MKRTGLRWAAALVVLALLLGFGFDGPFWLLSAPADLPNPVRWRMARLHSWRGATRARAAQELGHMGAAAAPAAPLLIEHLDDVGWANGWWAGFTHSLSFHGGPRLVGTEVNYALQGMGSIAFPALLEGLSHPRELVRASVVEILGVGIYRQAIPPIRHVLATDPSTSVQNSAVTVLDTLGDATWVVDHLFARLRDSDPHRRAIAAILLGSLRTPEVVPKLQEIARQDPDQNVRECAIAAAKRICTKASFRRSTGTASTACDSVRL